MVDMMTYQEVIETVGNIIEHLPERFRLDLKAIIKEAKDEVRKEFDSEQDADDSAKIEAFVTWFISLITISYMKLIEGGIEDGGNAE